MGKITMESLIEEQKMRIPKLIRKNHYQYEYVEEERKHYQKWAVDAIRLINIDFPNDKYVQEFEHIYIQRLCPEQQMGLLNILESFVKMPTVIPAKKTNSRNAKKQVNINTTINNTNSQSQSQEQNIAIDLFLEAIKDDLTGRQVKELKDVITESGNDKEKARNCIIAKMKSFGSNVASNIVANIITNPIIWNELIKIVR